VVGIACTSGTGGCRLIGTRDYWEQQSRPLRQGWCFRLGGVPFLPGVRYGWLLHVIENAADDPAIERPEAFLQALRATLES
jgi:hypothetical protein